MTRALKPDPVDRHAPLGGGGSSGSRRLAAWLVAWLVVLVLLSVLGDQLGSLPAPRALAISGVLVVLMANLVMPLLGQVAERWLTRRG